MLDGKTMYALYKSAGGDASGFDAIARFIKDTMPAEGRATGGYLYEGNSPFSYIPGDPISSVASGGSPLLQWLPSRYINYRFENVKHLEWISPEGFDGSQTYAEWLSGLTIPECGYGPATDWSGFEYHMSGGSFSWSTKMMKPYLDDNTRYYEKSPIYQAQGASAGMPLTSDREWALARLFFALKMHMSYVLPFGDRQNSDMEWDGLLKILQPGYVQSRRIGSGIPHWADPLYTNGVGVSTPATLLDAIRRNVRRIRDRASARNWDISFGDMAIVMNPTMWNNLAESIASGAMYKFVNNFNFSGEMSFKDFKEEYRTTRTGGLGFGTIDIDASPVPVLVDGSFGRNITLDPGGTPSPAVLGDVLILTRRVNNMIALEQQYVDWTKMDYPTNGLENIVQTPQGHVRAGWVTEANACYYYYAQMAGRVVSYMQPFQAVIQNAAIPTLDTNENESSMFFSQDFYGYNGERGGTGTSLLSPV